MTNSTSSGDDGWKPLKRSRSLSPEKADEAGASSGDNVRKSVKRSRSSILPSGEEVQEGNTGEVTLRKGTWTSAEDKILIDHVTKHGEGNWSSVQMLSGLPRSGKSCRLRWLNHLRPDLRKCPFTEEEMHTIINFHFKHGNKWAQLAALLPGRTDNEIKNYWRTRCKKLELCKGPLYPEGIIEEDVNPEDADPLTNEANELDDLAFKKYKPPQDVLQPHIDMLDSIYNLMFKSPSERLQGSDNLEGCSSSGAVPVFDKHCNNATLSSPYDYNDNHTGGYNNLPGIHAASNVSSSGPIYESMTFELPSLQYLQNQQSIWGTTTSLVPTLESVYTLIQSPKAQCDTPVPALVDSMLYCNSNQSLKGSNVDALQEKTDKTAPDEVIKNFTFDPISTQEWNDAMRIRDPLHQSSDYNAHHINICSIDEPYSVETNQDHGIEHDAFNQVPALNQVPARFSPKEEKLDEIDWSRPDAWLEYLKKY